MTTRNMRRAPRLTGELPVRLANGSGVTRDFNSLGVYFITDQSFNVNEPVDFNFTLSNQLGGRSVQVQCAGNVVRVEPLESKFGVAVTLGSFSVEEPLQSGHNHTSGDPGTLKNWQ